MSETDVKDAAALEPLPYQEAIRDFLKQEEREVWEWYSSNRVREDQADAVRFELLKSTYRLEREEHPDLYRMAEAVACRLSLDVPITIYQAQNPAGLNGSLAYLPDEAHIVLHGPVTSKLSAQELQALLAHELSHLLLWQGWDGEFLVVDQILAALTHDARAETAHFASARLFGLYNEIFCDRGSLLVVQDPLIVVGMLVKVQTGLDEVSAASYLRQAEEIFRKGPIKSDEYTHPEAFIRARAVQLWRDRDAELDGKIAEMIEGSPALEELDLLAQRRVSAWTRRLIDRMLSPAWMQTDTTLAHARLFFDDFHPPAHDHTDDTLPADLRTGDKPLINYYCFVLLDFVTADRELEDLPLAWALTLCEQLGLKESFAELARTELRLRKKQLEKIDHQKEDLLARVAKQSQRT